MKYRKKGGSRETKGFEKRALRLHCACIVLALCLHCSTPAALNSKGISKGTLKA